MLAKLLVLNSDITHVFTKENWRQKTSHMLLPQQESIRSSLLAIPVISRSSFDQLNMRYMKYM
jgi:hypothetical protein